jgi:hypothetical protein
MWTRCGPRTAGAPTAWRPRRSDLLGWLVGLPGLEPGTSSLSAKYRAPLCGSSFSQVTLDRRGRSYVVSSRPVKCSPDVLQAPLMPRRSFTTSRGTQPSSPPLPAQTSFTSYLSTLPTPSSAISHQPGPHPSPSVVLLPFTRTIQIQHTTAAAPRAARPAGRPRPARHAGLRRSVVMSD